jgi:hypothetical protein
MKTIYNFQNHPAASQMQKLAAEFHSGFIGQSIDNEYPTKQSGIIYKDIHSWIKCLSEYKFSYGMRFHGNMLALQHKIPSLWITHDSRTTELTSFLNLPAVSLSESIHFSGVNELYELTDYKAFNDNYSFVFKNYSNFLSKNGLNHSLPVCDTNNLSEKLTCCYFTYKNNKRNNPDSFITFDMGYLLRNISKMNQITKLQRTDTGLAFLSKGPDPYFLLPESGFVENIQKIKLEILPPGDTVFQVFYTTTENRMFSEKGSRKVNMATGWNSVEIEFPENQKIIQIRIDPGNLPGNYIIRSFSISYCIE